MLGLEFADDAFVPSEGPLGAESLPEGEYVFEVVKAEIKFKNTDKGGAQHILEFGWKVVSEGMYHDSTIRYAWFIKDKESANRVGGDLRKLGFDCELWTIANGRKFSEELPKAIEHIVGMRFTGKKATNKTGDKTFHNIYIIKREPDGKPERYGPVELNAVTSEIPF